MTARNDGKTQKAAAIMAGISERSGRRIEKGEVRPGCKRKRYWRTRIDPFVDVWENEIIPQLNNNPRLSPKLLFDNLQNEHPKKYSKSKLRTFQRRVNKWKALHAGTKRDAPATQGVGRIKMTSKEPQT